MINWLDIDTVLLDMDGTLLDLHFDNHFWLEHLPLRYAAHHGIDEREARDYLHRLSEELHGSLNWYCIDHWSETIKMDVMALKQETRHLIRFRPGTEAFLEFLGSSGKQTALVTNAHPKALSLKLEASGLGRHIDTHISSHQFKLAKENPGFWACLRAHGDFDYERCLFIDDNLNVLRCARNEGVRNMLQVLHPDTTQEPRARSEFPGILDFSEIMTLDEAS